MNATFVLSTGRCGTQWLQHALAATYPNEAVVTHEPIRGPYQPKSYLRAYDRLSALLSSEEVSRHLAYVSETLTSRPYIETGWPCYPALPLIADWLGGRIRIVHLVRHPVPAALSLAAHRLYNDRQDWIAGAAISPFDQGVVHKELARDWAGMRPYEKCLFWWTEINLYALELKERLRGVEFLFVRYEDLFGADAQTLEGLTRFMGLAYKPRLSELRSQHVDRYAWRSPHVDWTLVFKYAQTVDLAGRFGYDFARLSAPQFEARYFRPHDVA
jgi:hypothetical protein